MAKDVIDQVLLAPNVVKKWHELAAKESKKIPKGITDIPDEQAEVQEDGSLLLFCDVPGHRRISIDVAASDWSWAS